jgi:hypothetical protein
MENCYLPAYTPETKPSNQLTIDRYLKEKDGPKPYRIVPKQQKIIRTKQLSLFDQRFEYVNKEKQVHK